MMDKQNMFEEKIDASVNLKIGTLDLKMINCKVYTSTEGDTMTIVVEDGATSEHTIELIFKKDRV